MTNVLKNVRTNHPCSLVSMQQIDMYRMLYDDVTLDGVILQYQDRHALADLAITMIEIMELREHINEHGTMMEVQGDRNTVTKRNASCDVLNQKITIMHRLMKAFCMAPEYRPRVPPAPSNNIDDEFTQV